MPHEECRDALCTNLERNDHSSAVSKVQCACKLAVFSGSASTWPVQIYRSSCCCVAADYAQVTMQTSGSAHSRSRPSGPLHSVGLDINMSRTPTNATEHVLQVCLCNVSFASRLYSATQVDVTWSVKHTNNPAVELWREKTHS